MNGWGGSLAGQIRILYVVRTCSGGMLRHLLDLLAHLDRRDLLPLVAGPDRGRLPEAARSLGVEYFSLPDGGPAWLGPGLREELHRLIRGLGVRLVHTHGVQAGWAGRPAAHRAGVPVVATIHNFVYRRPGPAWQKLALAWYQRRLVPLTDRFIAVSRSLAEEVRRVERVPEEKIVIIHNGVDLDRTRVAPPGWPPAGLREGPVVGTIARLLPEKGVDVFLRACALLARAVPEARFLVVGDGPARPSLEVLAARLGLQERVYFAGHVEEAASLLPLLDVYVQPSRQEGFSLAVLEAMAAARPVVAARAGGLAEVVRQGENGYLVPPEDWEGMAREVLFLLRHPDLARRLGEAGRRLVREHYRVADMVRATEEVYRGLLADA